MGETLSIRAQQGRLVGDHLPVGPHLGHGLHSIRLVALGDQEGQIKPRTRADVQDPVVRIERTSEVPGDAARRTAR